MGQSRTKRLHAVPPPEPSTPPIVHSSSSPLTSEVVEVGPELAAKWLEKNHPNNRPIAWGRVEAFANDMRGGAWKLTHQAICFDGEGWLIDGQHRLHAIVNSKTAVELLVIRNAMGSYFDPIDRVGPRSVAVIMGNTGREVACLNVLRMLETGYSIHVPMTLNDAQGVLERHQTEISIMGTIPGRTKLAGPTQAAIVWALPVSREQAIDFAVKAASGEMIGRGHPAYAFRSWKERQRHRHGGSWEQALATLNCLRFHAAGQQMVNVTVGVAGYRGFCSRRRALKIPNTPTAELVESGNFTPKKGEPDE